MIPLPSLNFALKLASLLYFFLELFCDFTKGLKFLFHAHSSHFTDFARVPEFMRHFTLPFTGYFAIELVIGCCT